MLGVIREMGRRVEEMTELRMQRERLWDVDVGLLLFTCLPVVVYR